MITAGKHTLIPTAERTLWWEEKQTLFLSDLHLGKASHFRKSGIGISRNSVDTDLNRLVYQLRHFTPKRVVFLGDLFHSEYNLEWEKFIDLRQHFDETEFILVEGNHDIMDRAFYKRARVSILEEGYVEDGLEWRHHPGEITDHIQLCGHIHPGVRLTGKGRQRITLPCFVHEPQRIILPAFGRLTGKVHYDAPEGSVYYPIAGSEVLVYSGER